MPESAEKRGTKPSKLAEFLESTPPNVVEDISDLCERQAYSWVIAQPDVQLHCSSETCQGVRFFRSTSDRIYVPPDQPAKLFMTYVCRNCERNSKTYALIVRHREGEAFGTAFKLGELPSFGPRVPSRLVSLVGPDRDLFLRGRRAETQGLGIGAFAYYRRVVENQKGRIITEIGRVAERLGARPEVLTQFGQAARETQFSKAIDQVKAAIPESLLIGGQNPLTLLHSALSEGIHAQTDQECLELAQDIRIVLTELADRISQALKDQLELKEAVKRLLNRRTDAPSTDIEQADGADDKS